MLMEAMQIAATNQQSLMPFTSSINSAKQNKYKCRICAAPSLYKCPKCSIRTCSAKCSKMHKEDRKCDGQRSKQINSSWSTIFSASQFQEDKNGVEDQKFLQNLGNRICAKIGREEDKGETKTGTILASSNGINGPRQFYQLSQPERSLLQNAQFRRVWLRLDQPEYSPNNSHHEPFSDTIFWTCTVKFVCRSRQNQKPIYNQSKDEKEKTLPLVDYGMDEDEEEEEEDGRNESENEEMNDQSTKEIGELEEGEEEEEEEGAEKKKGNEGEWKNYTVHNIPESVRLVTLLRQFLHPKPHGSVISRSQLDLPLMEPFIRAAESILSPAEESKDNDKLGVYLEVQVDDGDEMRYYPADPEKTILENLRNRFVIDYPKFVVLLTRADEFGEMELPMMRQAEQKLLQAEREKQIGGNEANGSGFKDRNKWHQKKGGHGRRKGGKSGADGQFHQQAISVNPRPPPPQYSNSPRPYFYHPYVAASNPYHAPAHQYAQQQFVGGGWPHQQRPWLPRNKNWRGDRN